MQKQIRFNNKNLFYHVHGEGLPVILLHGFGEDSTVWHNQIETLQNYRLIIPDLPGTGQSEILEDMSMEGLAEAVKQIIDLEASEVTIVAGDFEGAKAPSLCTMIGHSMGGYITLAFAERYGFMLNGFGLVHSTAYADDDSKNSKEKKGIEFIEKNGAFEFLKTSIPNLYSNISKETKPEIIEKQVSQSHNFSPASLSVYYQAMMQRPNRINILKNTNIPVLFVMGKHDTAVPLNDGLEQCFLPQLSYIHILDNSGHMGMIEEANELNSILFNYVNSIQYQTL